MNNLSDNAIKAKSCQRKGTHYPRKRHIIGVNKFLNTGKPYIIEQCSECKCEYVREL